MATKPNPFAKFEKSSKDKDTMAVTKKFGAEGSPKEEAFDKKQMGKMPMQKFAKGGGVESRGKTVGKMITMKKGGKC